MANSLQFLSVARVNSLMMGLQDVRLLPADLKWLDRTVSVNATDDEILGRFLGHIQIADIIADDAEAAVYSSGRLSFESYKIPNLKHGWKLTQEQINQLLKLQQNPVPGDDFGLTSNFEKTVLDALLLGVRQRKEALVIAMLTDTFTYDRLGVKINGTFGMPADLKVLAGTSWTDFANATPVNDLLAIKLVGRVRYGIEYDRVTLSTAAFRAMIACTEFQTKARQYLAPNVSFVNISQYGLEQQMALAEAVTGLMFDLYDSRYWQQQESGALLSFPYLPVGTLILTDKDMDRNPMAWDFANGIVTETAVSSMLKSVNGTGAMIGSFAAPTVGPVAYATVKPDYNPPGITYWGVARGLSRRRMLQCSATLNVGAVVDQIPANEPPVI